MSADIACAISGTVAPASSIAPCRTGRHSPASTATAITAIITATSPAITAPGLEKALPAVTVCAVPVADELSVKLSHEGMNAATAPIAASNTSASGPALARCGRVSPAGAVKPVWPRGGVPNEGPARYGPVSGCPDGAAGDGVVAGTVGR